MTSEIPRPLATTPSTCPRSESGRSYQPESAPERNVPRGSRKDLRNAVQAARKGLRKPYLPRQARRVHADLSLADVIQP